MTTAVTLEEIGTVLIVILLMASTSIPFFVIGYLVDKKKWHRSRTISSQECSESPYPARKPSADHIPTKRERHPKAQGIHDMLLTLYEPKYPFVVGISDISTNTRLGFYSTHPYCRITIHEGWRSDTFLHEIGVHEYAHHIAMTEFPRKYKPHGREFKTLYSILVDCYNSKYMPHLDRDSRYYLKPEKRIKSITLNTK